MSARIATLDLDTSTREKRKVKEARESFTASLYFNAFDGGLVVFVYTRYAMSDKKGLLFEAIRVGDDEAKVKEMLISLLSNTDEDADNDGDDGVEDKERFDAVSYTHLTLPTILRV